MVRVTNSRQNYWSAIKWNWVSEQGSEETRVMGLSDGGKSFKIGFAVLIQYRRVTVTQPASHPVTQPRRRSIYRAYYVARLKVTDTNVKLVKSIFMRLLVLGNTAICS